MNACSRATDHSCSVGFRDVIFPIDGGNIGQRAHMLLLTAAVPQAFASGQPKLIEAPIAVLGPAD